MTELHRIPVHEKKNGQSWEDYVAEALAAGHAAQGYTINSDKYLDCPDNADIYRCERQGDVIIMLVPKGTPLEGLPEFAMDWAALAWENIRTGVIWSPFENRYFYMHRDGGYYHTPE